MKKRPWVIKAGGELLSLPAVRKKIIAGLKKYHSFRPIVFVHGGGPQIEEALVRNNIAAKFVGGRRVTSPAAMTVVEQVLSGEINKGFAAELCINNIPAVGLSGRDGKSITAEPIRGLGRAAKPVHIDTKLVFALLQNGFLPVFSTVGSDKKGRPVNINADDAASALATQLKAERLIFLTNINGVLDGSKKRIPILKISRIDELIAGGVIQGGMIPKVQSARRAIHQGVGEVDIALGKNGIEPSGGTRILK